MEKKNREKILEKYQELGNPAKVVLSIMENSKNPIKEWTWKELRLKTGLSEGGNSSLKAGIDQLILFNLLTKKGKKKNEIRYTLNKDKIHQLFLIGRKQSDKINLDSYKPNEIINENTNKSKTTIYGLNPLTFRAITEKRCIDIQKNETYKFSQGIKAKEVFGLNFGVPLGIKVKGNSSTTEEEILEKQKEYYLDLVKKGMRIIRKDIPKKKRKMIQVDEESLKDTIEEIIYKYQNERISFKQIQENILNKLLELKKENRFNELEKTFKSLIKEEDKKIKRILNEFRKEFLLILNHCDIDKVWLEETIFKFHGYGRGLFSTIGISEEASEKAKKDYETKWKRNIKFSKAMDKLNKEEKESVLDFLIKVLEINIELYPTHVTLLSRVNSSDIMPLTQPKPLKDTKTNQK